MSLYLDNPHLLNDDGRAFGILHVAKYHTRDRFKHIALQRYAIVNLPFFRRILGVVVNICHVPQNIKQYLLEDGVDAIATYCKDILGHSYGTYGMELILIVTVNFNVILYKN